MPSGDRPWWEKAVVYQVYLRSFADGNGDGIGDLAGLRERLDHIVELGVDAIWLNPCYPSPQRDHGYDIAAYTDIEPDYGTLADFDALLTECHHRGLRVLLDLVANHCSSDHPFFQAALESGSGSRERDRFIFRPGRGSEGQLPPNDWQSVFGGPAWTRLPDGEWYLHLFDTSQPDFNWRNKEVAEYFEYVLRFWFARGVDGFRLDVAQGLLKAAELPDWPGGGSAYNIHMWNQPEVHDVYRQWRRIGDEYGGRLLIGEVWVPAASELAEYLRDDELHQAFFFDLLGLPWQAEQFRAAIDNGIATCGRLPTWTLANHDVPRAVTRLGMTLPKEVEAADIMSVARARGELDLDSGGKRARAALLLLLALPGSAYLYQGEELGLPEVLDLPPGARQDPIWIRSSGADAGRDGCRVPLPWTDQEPSFGFSTAVPATAPWLPQPEWFSKFAVESQAEDSDSMLTLHRRAISMRRRWAATDSPIEWIDTGHADMLAFARGHLVCVVNFGAVSVTLLDTFGRVDLASGPTDASVLPPSTAVWMTREV